MTWAWLVVAGVLAVDGALTLARMATIMWWLWRKR